MDCCSNQKIEENIISLERDGLRLKENVFPYAAFKIELSFESISEMEFFKLVLLQNIIKFY